MGNYILGDKLTEAFENKKNDVNSFIWKGPKKFVNGKRVQEELKLMDAPEEQLKKYYAHCKSMLYSKDKDDPGRKELVKIIRDQQLRCEAELYMRYLRKKGTIPLEFRKALSDYLNTDDVKKQAPRSTYRSVPVSSIIEVPDEYKEVTIELTLNACLSALGIFHRKHITNNFLTKLGLWFTKEEIKEYLSQKDENGQLIDRLEQVKSNLNLRPDVKLHTDYNGGLSYLEFRAIHNLKNERYEKISELALNTLNNKVLPRLEDVVRKQAEFWEEKMKEIEKVCELRELSYE
jgi:hypothetical protein